MPDVTIRPGAPSDAEFLAVAVLESDRGHVGIGSWDFFLPVPDDERLAIIAKIVSSEHRSYAHWSKFLVAECDAELAGAVASYIPRERPARHSQRRAWRRLAARRGRRSRHASSVPGRGAARITGSRFPTTRFVLNGSTPFLHGDRAVSAARSSTGISNGRESAGSPRLMSGRTSATNPLSRRTAVRASRSTPKLVMPTMSDASVRRGQSPCAVNSDRLDRDTSLYSARQT